MNINFDVQSHWSWCKHKDLHGNVEKETKFGLHPLR